MIEILLLLSIVTIFIGKMSDKLYIPYIIKFLQFSIVALIPNILGQSFLTKALYIDSTPSLFSSLLVFVLGLEAEHFKIRRWIKESIYLLMIVAVFSNLLSITLITVLFVFVLLMVCRKNRLIDFVSLFLLITSFLIYFSELKGSYNLYSDKYVVYFSTISEFLFPVTLVLSFLLIIISSWGYLRSMIFTPVFAVLILLIKFNQALDIPNIALEFGLFVFTISTLNNFQKYLIRKNVSTAINVLCSISFLNVLFSALSNNFSLALVQTVLISVVLYSARIFNLDKSNSLFKFKTITIYFVLLNISFFPFGMSGLYAIDSVANFSNPLVVSLLVANIIISWIVLFLSIKSFKDQVSFNLWESSLKERFFSLGLLVLSFTLSYINLPEGFVSNQSSRILIKSSFLNCCRLPAIEGYSFNISLLALIILFSMLVYGLSILDFSKVWLAKYKYISLFSNKIRSNKLKEENSLGSRGLHGKNRFCDVVDLLGQSSSFLVIVVFFLFYIGQLLILIE